MNKLLQDDYYTIFSLDAFAAVYRACKTECSSYGEMFKTYLSSPQNGKKKCKEFCPQ